MSSLDSWPLGIVSNCWRLQLARGESLDSLVSRAADEGYKQVELRQACLGAYERGDPPIPDSTSLGRLQRRSPGTTFGIALAYNCLSPAASPTDPLFVAGLRAAQAVAGNSPPRLRLVDLEHTLAETDPDGLRHAAEGLARLLDTVAGAGGELLVENARQSWVKLRALIRLTRELAGSAGVALQFCYDPANLVGALDRPALGQAVRDFSPGDVGMLHFKQVGADGTLSTVSEGAVDWRDQLAALSALGFSGPALFEIPSADDIWLPLQQSRDYLLNLVFRQS